MKINLILSDRNKLLWTTDEKMHAKQQQREQKQYCQNE